MLVKGPNVFKEYLNKPDATRAEFDDNGAIVMFVIAITLVIYCPPHKGLVMLAGYFKTGDVVRYDASVDSFAILGRASADILKSGGYKLSALEIERYVLEHSNVAEVAVVGVDDEEWGQRVASLVVLKQKEAGLTLEELRDFLKDKMSGYKLPTILKVGRGAVVAG